MGGGNGTSRWKGLSGLLRPSRNHLASEPGNFAWSRDQAMSVRSKGIFVGNCILDTADAIDG